jgi:hypothetical protein
VEKKDCRRKQQQREEEMCLDVWLVAIFWYIEVQFFFIAEKTNTASTLLIAAL